MKAGREHRVPLSPRAMAILREVRPDGLVGGKADEPILFPRAKAGQPLSSMALLKLLRRMGRHGLTAHGFRSTFRDWAAARTNFPSEVPEMALAHAVGDKVEAAYRRGDLFDRRRRLMDTWAGFCSTNRPPIAYALTGTGAEVSGGCLQVYEHPAPIPLLASYGGSGRTV